MVGAYSRGGCLSKGMYLFEGIASSRHYSNIIVKDFTTFDFLNQKFCYGFAFPNETNIFKCILYQVQAMWGTSIFLP